MDKMKLLSKLMGIPFVMALMLPIAPSYAASGITQSLPGSSHYLQLDVLQSHGRMVSFTTYYSLDHYVHIDDLSGAPNVKDIQMYICRNLGACDDHINTTDTDSVGLLGQSHVTIHRNTTLTFYPRGNGFSCHQGHYEHGGEPEMEFKFQDGFVLDVFMPAHPYLYAINLVRTNSGHSHAQWEARDIY